MNLEELVAKDLAARAGFAVKEDTAEQPVEEQTEQPVEEVQQEQPVEEVQQESSLKEETTDTPPQEEKVETPKPQVVEPDLDDIRAQLREELAKEYQGQKPSFANETIARLNELASSGIDIDSPDFWKWQYTDVAQQALELRKLELELENPNLNERQIARLLKRSYPALFDESFDAQDTEYQEAMEDLSIDATRSVTKLKKHKESVQLPKVDLQQKEQNEAAAKAAHEAFLKDVRQNVQSYTEEPIKLDKNLEIKYIPSDDTKKFVESSIVNNQTWFVDNYVNENKVDYARLRRDMARIHDFDKIVKTVYEQGISVGKEQVVDNLENASENVSSQKQQKAQNFKDQILEQFAIQNSRKR
jgi:hypothetical protein